MLKFDFSVKTRDGKKVDGIHIQVADRKKIIEVRDVLLEPRHAPHFLN